MTNKETIDLTLLHHPNVFNVKFYGAKGNGVSKIDAATTSGSATVTSATATFTSVDIGKIIVVARAGASGADLVTTIASRNSSTSIQLATTASASLSNIRIDYGTDDTAAIRLARDAAFAAGGGKVYFPLGLYILNGALETSLTGTNPNSQIGIPYLFNDQPTRCHVVFEGEGTPHFSPSSWAVDVGPGATGVRILSTIRGSGTAPAIFGSAGPTPQVDFNYNYVSFKNMVLLVLCDPGTGGPSMGGISMGFGCSVATNEVVVSINGSIYNSGLPTHEAAGIICNAINGESMSHLRNTLVIGFKYGIVKGDHTILDNAQIFACVNGLVPTANFQATKGDRINIHWCINALMIPNATILGITSGHTYMKIELLNVEQMNNGNWWDYSTTIKDVGNFGHGEITWHVAESFVGVNYSLFVKTGGTNTDFQIRSLGSTFGGGGGGTPAGSNQDVQFNNSGAFGATTMKYNGGAFGLGASPNFNILQGTANNNDGGSTLIPNFNLANSNATAATGADYNFAAMTPNAGLGAIIAQFIANYGIGASAPFSNGTGGYIGTRTNHSFFLFANNIIVISITSAQFVRMHGYGTGAKTGTAVYGLAFDASGNIIEVALSGGGGSSSAGSANDIQKSNGSGGFIAGGLTHDNSTGVIALTKSQNAVTGLSVTNSNTGASAQARILLNGDTSGFVIGQQSSTMTPYGNRVANAGYLYTGAGPIAIMVDSNNSFSVSTGTGAPALTRLEITGAGVIKLGTTSTTGYVWTASGTDGSGAWAAATGGSTYTGGAGIDITGTVIKADLTVPSIKGTNKSGSAQTATSSTGLTTANDGINHLYSVNPTLIINSITGGGAYMNIIVTYTDRNNNTQAKNFKEQDMVAGTFYTAAGTYAFPPMTIEAKPNTAITVIYTIGSGTANFDYNYSIIKVDSY